MTKVSKITISPEFALLVDRYQQEHGIKTQTAALYELIARGWSDWIGELALRHNDTSAASWTQDDDSERVLFEAYDADPTAPPSFAAWFAARFAPKHGGDRKSVKVSTGDGK